MRILVCPDSFKGSLSALEAARAIAIGIHRARPHARAEILPLADGGEGTLEALARFGRSRFRKVHGPLGRPVRARYLILRRRTAVIEMAQASGLSLAPAGRLNPMLASTRGVGELIDAALGAGCRKIFVALGGSATVDGGAGCAAALGVRLLDRRGKSVPDGGRGLTRITSVDARDLRRRLRGIRLFGATDVDNPLLGPRGAARVFGPQKGASPAGVRVLERGLANLARVCRRDLGRDPSRIPGAGSAGGLGAGLVAFLGARLIPGADWLLDLLDFDARLKRADLVLTGEGKLDVQTGMGKLVKRVAARARRTGVPVIGFAGKVELGPKETSRLGLKGVFPIADPGTGARYSMKHASYLLTKRVSEVVESYRWRKAGSRRRLTRAQPASAR